MPSNWSRARAFEPLVFRAVEVTQAVNRFDDVLSILDVVPLEDLSGFAAADLHGHRFGHPGPPQIAHSRPPQVGRALRELGIRMIPAYSPQARGRSERNFGTWQGRLPQELRLRGITTREAANQFLREEYIAELHRRFRVPAAQPGTAFVPARGRDLEGIFSVQQERVVNRDNTVQIGNRVLQIEEAPWRDTLAGCRVQLYEHLDGTLRVGYGPHVVGRFSAQGIPLHETVRSRRGKAVEKPLRGKPQTGFPLHLGIPPTTRDSHFPTATATTEPLL